MKAFLFPGQGSQEVGMGAEFLKRDAFFAGLVDFASELAGRDLAKICLRGPERELNRCENLQPLLVAVCLGFYSKLKSSGIEQGLVGGHSLGEVSALAAAGVVSIEDAIRIAAVRGKLMAAAAEAHPGGMLAVIGTSREQAAAAVAVVLESGQLFVANDNAPTQVLLSGTHSALDAALSELSRAKIPARRLAVAGPWHTPLMASAAEEFMVAMAKTHFNPAQVPVLANVSGAVEQDAGALRRLLVENLTNPVQWRSCMKHLVSAHPEAVFEVGPGRVLSGLARANGLPATTRVINVNNHRGLLLAGLHLATEQSSLLQTQDLGL